MTMPIQFDTAQYAQTLIDSGVPPEQAEAHAKALTLALNQPVANDSDLLIARAEIQAMFTEHEAKMKAWVLETIDAKLKEKLRPVYWMLGALLVMQGITLGKLFL